MKQLVFRNLLGQVQVKGAALQGEKDAKPGIGTSVGFGFNVICFL